ncbi:probable beta-D-xylosidase 5 [Aristolochia californica]|uniref:probable beta-D-xylosidase 5 n=1 Tax=Aristolochia californica TaxID=171875 RepID=UPI0035D81328
MNDFDFCNKSLPYPVRVKELVDRMAMTEKAMQLGDQAYGVPRLGLLPYEWWSEALHGVSDVGPGTRFDKDIVPGATSFPTPIFTTASFNESLWKMIGQVVSTEARAMFNLGLGGLTYWSPNINIARDPRWGRILETPGEDPYVVGRYAVNYVRGLQDVEGHEHDEDLNSRPLKISSCCKHYAAYDLDGWLTVDRNHFDARVSSQDMEETFLRPFEMCVKEGDVSSVMCSFNKINGVPSCTDNRLLSEKVRGEWDLHGYIMADCDSIDIIIKYEKWLNDSFIDAISQALEAGMDLDCGLYYTKNAVTAVAKGRVKEEEVDKALKNLYTVLMRLGFFDGSPGDYDQLGKDDICSKEHIELAAQAAREGMVLLKNDGTLPLNNKALSKIALVGPHANATDALIGNYAGIPCKFVSPLDAFSEILTVDYQQGCQDVVCNSDELIKNATEAAKQAEATIIFAGIDLSQEREWVDRIEITLPGYQTQLINEVAASAAGPVVLVLLNGGVLDVSFAQENPKISAIIWAGYPGEQGGHAIADVVFGKYNPGGRLPLTWYHGDYVEKLPMTSMQMRPDDELGYPGRTYKFFNGSVVYPFGHGLSYTNFAYKLGSKDAAKRHFKTKLHSLLHCKSMNYTDHSIVRSCPAMRVDDLSCDDSIDFQVEVSNTGKRDGDTVVMVYSVPPAELQDAPAKQVVGFQRVSVPAGGMTTAKFSLNICKSFSVVKNSGYVVLPSGEHTVVIGDANEPTSVSLQIDFE